jgi:hypothetical protein
LVSILHFSTRYSPVSLLRLAPNIHLLSPLQRMIFSLLFPYIL